MLNYPIYIAGEFQPGDNVLPVINPFTGEVFAETYLTSERQYEEAIQAATKAKKALAAFPSYKRYEVLRFVADSITKDRKHLAEILCMESAKPIRYALGEVDRAAQTFLVA